MKDFEFFDHFSSIKDYRRPWKVMYKLEDQKCFIGWMQAFQERSYRRLIAIDGKTLRGSYNRESRDTAIHMVSAYCIENQQMLGKIKTEDHSNGITAIPELIHLLDIQNALVTIDAMGCQTEVAEKIISKGADY